MVDDLQEDIERFAQLQPGAASAENMNSTVYPLLERARDMVPL